MRYLIQFIVPALVVVGVVYLLRSRRREAAARGDEPGSGSDALTVLAILTLGAAVAIGTALALGWLSN